MNRLKLIAVAAIAAALVASGTTSANAVEVQGDHVQRGTSISSAALTADDRFEMLSFEQQRTQLIAGGYSETATRSNGRWIEHTYSIAEGGVMVNIVVGELKPTAAMSRVAVKFDPLPYVTMTGAEIRNFVAGGPSAVAAGLCGVLGKGIIKGSACVAASNSILALLKSAIPKGSPGTCYKWTSLNQPPKPTSASSCRR